jgi:hypothetical protein
LFEWHGESSSLAAYPQCSWEEENGFKNNRPEHRKASVKRITQGLLIISAEGAHNLRRCTFFYRRSVAGEKTLTGGLLEGADAGAAPQLQ